MAIIYRTCARSDNRVDDSEKIVLRIITVSTLVMNIIDFAMIIWGAVVVFGAWATWTHDIEEYHGRILNGYEVNYCKETPMTFAFSILIVKWVSLNEHQNDILEYD